MSKRLLMIVLAALFSVLLGAFVWQQNIQAASISEISIQHTPCYGPYPVYKLTLGRDGTAAFAGVAHVDKIGTCTAKFGGFDRLTRATVRCRFWHLNEKYTASVTDMSHTTPAVG